MKISGCIFQNRMIRQNTEDTFEATYKGRIFHITTDHGHGDAEYSHLKRYDITVRMFESGIYDVSTYEDHHTMRDAIRSALIGACLLD